MGKSPAKWIKAKLFGKKSTNSERGIAGKEATIISKASSGVVASYDPVISNPQPVVVYKNGHRDTGNLKGSIPPGVNNNLLPGSQDDGLKSTEMTPADESDLLKQELAAAKVQAALRGFLARRAFWALKGIIRLQALIRGHLVRRQAVATLRCMQGIVKFQALVRGQAVRLSEAGIDLKQKCILEKLKLETIGVLESNCSTRLSRNVFAQKLLASLPEAMPRSLGYDSGDVNSTWSWLERWSSSHFWGLVVESRKEAGSKASRKSGSYKGEEIVSGRPKCGVRRNWSANHDNFSVYGKPKGSLKKSTSHQAGPAQENPQNELEKVKHNLRKVSLTKSGTNDKPETVIDKPKSKTSKMRISEKHVALEQSLSNSIEKDQDSINSISNEKPNKSVDTMEAEKDNGFFDAVTKESELVTLTQVVEKFENSEIDEPSSEALQQLIQKNENSTLVAKELHSKEDSSVKENQQGRRRKSLSTKHGYTENDAQNTPTLPSYMQATQSAKARIKAQGSPRLSQDTPENGIVRRHSLPSSASGKPNNTSPRIQKPVQGNGKGRIKSDKSLSASTDLNCSERLTEWRR